MNKILTKIYRLESLHFESLLPKKFILDFIENHNSSGANYYTPIECKPLKNGFEIMLFVHIARESKPDWQRLLLELSGNNSKVQNIKSQYPSFILFFYKSNESYAITGGAGYRAIQNILDTQFGFKIVERLIDTSRHDIRSLSRRVFLGVELASNSFFKADYVFDNEDNFGKYYRELNVFIDSKKLKEIGITTTKKQLLVRGEMGFRIDTKVSFDELLLRIEKLSEILMKDSNGVELNPFRKLTRSELNRSYNGRTFESILNQYLISEHFKSFQKCEISEIYHPNLIEYLNSSIIKARYKDHSVEILNNQRLTPRGIIGQLNITENCDSVAFPKFKKLVQEIELSIRDDETGLNQYPSTMFNWFYGEVEHDGKKYLKFENEWFNYSIKFSANLNERIQSLSNNISIEEMKPWTDDLDTEGQYNDEYARDKNFIVGDGKFHKRIEVADLISWSIKEEELVIYHVKKDLGRDLRILQSQIINSARIISEFRSDLQNEHVKQYHYKLGQSAKKLGVTIPQYEEFKEILKLKNVRFVFGVATSSKSKTMSDVVEEIKASQSAVAKIAILHSFYTITQMGYKFSLAKIIKE